MISGMDDREHDERPWGSYTVLDEGAGYKVKRIVVMPGKRLSYQQHHQRSEHWFAVSGVGTVTLDGATIACPPVRRSMSPSVPRIGWGTTPPTCRSCSSRYSAATISARTTSSAWKTTTAARGLPELSAAGGAEGAGDVEEMVGALVDDVARHPLDRHLEILAAADT